MTEIDELVDLYGDELGRLLVAQIEGEYGGNSTRADNARQRIIDAFRERDERIAELEQQRETHERASGAFILVKIEDATRKLYLHNYVGEGELGGLTVEITTAIPTGSPILSVGDKKYLVPMESIVQAVARYHQEKECESDDDD